MGAGLTGRLHWPLGSEFLIHRDRHFNWLNGELCGALGKPSSASVIVYPAVTIPIYAVEPASDRCVPSTEANWRRSLMDGIVYIVGLIVVVMAVLSLIGLR